MSDQTISAGFSDLMRQSWQTAHEYLIHAVENIDLELGKGYAAKHPELIAAFMEFGLGEGNGRQRISALD